jgi:hypothetical protein
MTGQPFLEHQNSGGSKAQVGAELRLDLDEPGDHSIESYGPVTGVGGHVDVVAPAPFGARCLFGPESDSRESTQSVPGRSGRSLCRL